MPNQHPQKASSKYAGGSSSANMQLSQGTPCKRDTEDEGRAYGDIEQIHRTEIQGELE